MGLAMGANPDIGVWCLERSYNERYCVLSYATFHSCEDGSGKAMAQALLEGGADPSGTDYDGLNKPLFGALSCGQWDLAEQLLDRGASFTGGNNDQFLPDPGARLQFPSDPNYGHRNEDLVWAEREIGSLIPLADICEVPGFYRGDGQGGSYGRFLPACCAGDDVETLKRFEARGLPLVLTAQDVVKFCRSWSVPFRCLEYILARLEAPPEVMFRMRRRCPDIATKGFQYLCRPEQNGSNVIKEFNAHGQTPLELPDGSRYYAFLDAIASPGHDLGFVPEHHVFVLGVAANYRRRTDHVITRGLRFQWKLQPVQCSIYRHFQRRAAPWDVLPVVKEVDGTFFWTGVTLGQLWWLDWPEDWKDLVKRWVEGKPGEEIIAMAEARVSAQDATNVRTPPVVLPKEELDGYPREFWPCLRQLENGLIGVTEESCRFDPPIRERYQRWAAENKPDLETFVPDPRLMDWPLWDSIPWDLQPFFVYDDLFGKPTVITEGRNEYERAMVRKAVRWNNAQFMEAFRQLNEGKGG
jgi:hypothetical protein